MSEAKKFRFHFREVFTSGNSRDYFLDAKAFDIAQAIELSLMGINGKQRLGLIRDLTDFNDEDYIDYVTLTDYESRTGALPTDYESEIIRLKRKFTIKDLLEDVR